MNPELQLDLMELADIGQPVKLALELHRQLRSQFGSVPLRMPLHAISRAIGIVGVEEFATQSFEGTLLVRDGRGVIGLRKGLRPGRRNFTLGHEIGHFLIPHHRFRSTSFQCGLADMRRERGRSANWEKRPVPEQIEVEANEFSAALLVPLPEFQAERKRLGSACDVAHIRQLAKVFDVSQEMMAQFYVRNSNEQIAIITSHGGKVRRIIPRDGFPFLGLRRDSLIPSSSLTSSFRPAAGNYSSSDLCEVPTHAWLERRGSVTALYEQVVVQENGWAMTLLVADEAEEDEDEDDTTWNRSAGRVM